MITFDKNDIHQMVPFIDIHTHRPFRSDDVIAVSNIFLQKFNSEISYPFSTGIHPWHSDQFTSEEIAQMLDKIGVHPNLIAIGETGLDKKCNISIEIQKISFGLHIQMAEKIGKPLIIHCLNAWDELIALASKTSAKMILHGFNGNIEQTKQLIRKGFLFSIGKSVMDEKSKICRSVQIIPSSSLFCETDESDFEIKEIYERIAKLRGTNLNEMKEEIYHNFLNVTGREID
jgi:TatD DNase family protein